MHISPVALQRQVQLRSKMRLPGRSVGRSVALLIFGKRREEESDRFMRSSHDMSSAADDVLFAVGFEGEMDRRQITLHLAMRRGGGR